MVSYHCQWWLNSESHFQRPYQLHKDLAIWCRDSPWNPSIVNDKVEPNIFSKTTSLLWIFHDTYPSVVGWHLFAEWNPTSSHQVHLVGLTIVFVLYPNLHSLVLLFSVSLFQTLCDINNFYHTLIHMVRIPSVPPCSPVCPQHFYQFIIPISPMAGHNLGKNSLNNLIGAFHLVIFLWMISWSNPMTDFIFLNKHMDQVRCELWPSICHYFSTKPKVKKNVFKQKV